MLHLNQQEIDVLMTDVRCRRENLITEMSTLSKTSLFYRNMTIKISILYILVVSVFYWYNYSFEQSLYPW